MKRNSLALIIHPYKNILLKKDRMRKLLDTFAIKLLDITAAHPNFRINISLPGYMLHYLDPLLLTKLNELNKTSCLEWLTSGYTEPFLGFSPLWLSDDNVKYGLETYNELVGNKPSGYIPAFSNWEPSSIATLRNFGISYVVLSRRLLQKNVQNYCGFWITEHTGESMLIIPVHNLIYNNAPADILNWLDHLINKSHDKAPLNMIAINYLLPLVVENNIDPFKWLTTFSESLDKILIKYQMNLLHEFPTLSYPLGLQEIPPSLEFRNEEGENILQMPNFLHTFDSVGLLQRKMMNVAEKIKSYNGNKDVQSLKKQMFFIQDINRYLPNISSGFPFIEDRLWTFSQMIEIEREILKNDNLNGGQIQIADFLKNGIKSIVMSNKKLKVYIDHKSGGQIFELDFRDRLANIFCSHNPNSHMPPRIIVPGKSRTSFIDHFLDENCQRSDFLNDTSKQNGDFVKGQFEYKVRKTKSNVKAILTRYGSINLSNKSFPLNMEKVFGLEKDNPELTFAYQLSNHSLKTYIFKFAIELSVSLPGVLLNQAEISCQNQVHDKLAWNVFTIENTTKWHISDRILGTEIEFLTQKPVTVWCFPTVQSSQYQGTTIVLTLPVSLEENSMWSLMGKITCKKISMKGSFSDAV
jgi:hypothetical protein